jgi:hypothetical protein
MFLYCQYSMLEFMRIAHFSFNLKNFNINDCINNELIEITKNYISNYIECMNLQVTIF